MLPENRGEERGEAAITGEKNTLFQKTALSVTTAFDSSLDDASIPLRGWRVLFSQECKGGHAHLSTQMASHFLS